MRTLRFSGSFEDWRQQARQALRDGLPPSAVTWQIGDQPADLFAGHEAPVAEAAPGRLLAIPRELPDLLAAAACFRCDDRWALMYRVLWRVVNGDRCAMLAGDTDGAELHRRNKAIRRETHHVHAFLRFRERPADDGGPRFVAWHEPQHDVLARAVEHFQHRMGRTRWLIATPDGAALCDGDQLQLLTPCPPALAELAREADDPGESLWRAYYSSTFNPARVNEKVMRGHMPARFWRNLSEGDLIPGMVSQARAGQQRLAQAAEVGGRFGKEVLIAGERAGPARPLPDSLSECQRCELWRKATCAVAGEGPSGARLMLVGEQPGDREDLAGQVFIGPAGEVLNQALKSSELDRSRLYLTNAVKHFKWEPRGGIQGRAAIRKHASPKPAEIRACHPWLARELEEVAPRVVIALGRTALASLLGVFDPQRIRLADYVGRAVEHEGRWILVAPHPAAVLRAGDGGAQRFDELCEALALARRLLSEADALVSATD